MGAELDGEGLATLGAAFRVTSERIRQIEAVALQRCRKRMPADAPRPSDCVRPDDPTLGNEAWATLTAAGSGTFYHFWELFELGHSPHPLRAVHAYLRQQGTAERRREIIFAARRRGIFRVHLGSRRSRAPLTHYKAHSLYRVGCR